jgi:hypothetical protein
LFNTFDVFATSILLKVDGFTEANIFAKLIIDNFGYMTLLVIKYFFCISLFVLLTRIENEFYKMTFLWIVIIYFLLNIYQLAILAII